MKRHPHQTDPTRRHFLATSAALVGAAGIVRGQAPAAARPEAVAILKATAYDASLERVIADGLKAVGIGREHIVGRSVLLKPNLVEPSSLAPHINTHPQFVRAAVEVFRRLDASEVNVGEGQGHVRDSQYVLEQSGLGQVLLQDRIPFIDLNHDDVFIAENRLRKSQLTHFFLPASLRRAQIVVSLPKLKVHHWAGVTLSMKNLFGVMPSLCYGWPKNVLHVVGIENSIMDIAATVRPDLAIVDGVIGMEGDGPIMGTPKPANLVIVGRNPVAVDATGARLMGFNPRNIAYLKGVEGVLGPLDEGLIKQRAEPLEALKQKFELIDNPATLKFRI